MSENGGLDKKLGIKPKDQETDEDTGHDRKKYVDGGQSIHGDMAAKRRAIQELLFFASVGDLRRCQRIVRIWNLQVSENSCCDYDRRTPLHLASSEGAYKVTEWLITQGVEVNALDRFKHTPLEDALRGDYREVAKLLVDNGGKVYEDGQMVELAQSQLASAVGLVPQRLNLSMEEFDPEWEIDPSSLTILEKLGEGEFGVVHRAKWYGTSVAAKILKGSNEIALGDFRGEIDILRRVHHPNAVQFLGACTKREPYILVTELMSGGSLADAFRRPEAFPLRRAVETALDAAHGLEYLHQRRPSPIIHRDLKPGNLMFSGSLYTTQRDLVYDHGTVKLADFGLSKTLPVNRHADFGYMDSKFRLTGETGSYRYMAPEVFRHEPYNSRVDVYSFSMIVYQLFEVQPPFAGMDPIDAARQAALYELRPQFIQLQGPDPIKKEVREIIEWCWRPNAEDRPSFAQIVAAFEGILVKLPRKSLNGGGNDGCCSVS